MWILQNFFWLYVEKSFTWHYLKKYFSYKKLKFLTLIYFWDLFKKYWSPNLPLLRRRGSNFVPKEEGSAILKAREIIFKQLVFEELGLDYVFSKYEFWIFEKLNIDPFDKNYYWPTRRLYILDLSWHNGRILRETAHLFIKDQEQLINSVSKKPTIIKSPTSTFSALTILIIKQFYYWWTKFLILLLKKWIFFTYWVCSKILKNTNYTNKFANLFDSSIPTYFSGSFQTFFALNYLQNQNLKESNNFLKSLEKKLQNNFFDYFSIFNKLKIEFIFDYKFFVNMPWLLKCWRKEISVKWVFKLLADSDYKLLWKNSFHKYGLYKLPNFLQTFFYLLLKNQLTFSMFNNKFLRPLINFFWDHYFSTLKFKKNKILNYLQWLAKIHPPKTKKSNTVASSNPMAPYLMVRKNIKSYPNWDRSILNFQPHGPNPFFNFSNSLQANKSINYPAAVTKHNHYLATKPVKKVYKFWIKTKVKWILVYNLQKWILWSLLLLEHKNWNGCIGTFFWKLFIDFYFIKTPTFSFLFKYKKNYKLPFSLVRFILPFNIDVLSSLLFKIKKFGKDFKKINYWQPDQSAWLYDYFKNDYCLLRWDYFWPLKLNEAQKNWMEFMWKYFARLDLKWRTNYFVIDNMIHLLRFTYFFRYFSCVGSALCNNLYLTFDYNFLLILNWQCIDSQKFQLIIWEKSYYHYLWVYFKIKYYIPNNFLRKNIILKKKC